MDQKGLAQFRHFREWRDGYVRANNVVMALGVGVEVALGALPDDRPFFSPRMTSVFPTVGRVRNLDMTVKEARSVFNSAHVDLAFMAIPGLVALHLEYMVKTIEMLQAVGSIPRKYRSKSGDEYAPSAWNADELLKGVRFGQRPTVHDELMGMCIAVRNCIMHGGGRADRRPVSAWRNLSAGAKKRWISLAGSELKLKESHLMLLGWGEIQAVLAVTKESAREINRRSVQELGPEQRAEVAVMDYAETAPRRANCPSSPTKNLAKLENINLRGVPVQKNIRRILGHVKTNYPSMGITPEDVMLAAGRRGIALA